MRQSSLFLLLTLAPVSTALAQDSDNDGVPNTSDAVPCDPAAVGRAFAPGQGDHGLLLFEDRWPARGDLDFNDVVLAHAFELRLDVNGGVVGVRAVFSPVALGGLFRMGLGLHLPVPASSVTSVTRRIGSGDPQPVAPMSDAELTVSLSSDLRELFVPASAQINSLPSQARLAGALLEVDIRFAAPVALSASDAPFDVFVFHTEDPTHEIHRPAFAGSSRMNVGLYGQADDGSSPGRRFVDGSGLPFALVVPTATPYPAEGVAISTLFPDILAFASSGGTQALDFYASNVAATVGYADVNGDGPYTPVLSSALTIDRSCVPPLGVPGSPATSCQAIVDGGANLGDGTYFLDPDGAGGAPEFPVFCRMSAVPVASYVELVQAGPGENQAVSSAARSPTNCGAYGGTDAVRTFTRVRLDPATMAVDQNDFTYATVTGGPVYVRRCAGGTYTNSGPGFGVAFSCRAENSGVGTANIDLRGTPFSIATNSNFGGSGWRPRGTLTFSPDRKVADMTGGGFCGAYGARTLYLAVDP